MSKNSFQIQKHKMSCSITTPEAKEVTDLFNAVVRDRLHEGRARVIEDIARKLGMKPSRVAKLLREEIPRVWADEHRAVREWHASWQERQIEQLRHKAEMLEARTRARRNL